MLIKKIEAVRKDFEKILNKHFIGSELRVSNGETIDVYNEEGKNDNWLYSALFGFYLIYNLFTTKAQLQEYFRYEFGTNTPEGMYEAAIDANVYKSGVSDTLVYNMYAYDCDILRNMALKYILIFTSNPNIFVLENLNRLNKHFLKEVIAKNNLNYTAETKESVEIYLRMEGIL